jgi:opacity protein-like surface antigen
LIALFTGSGALLLPAFLQTTGWRPAASWVWKYSQRRYNSTAGALGEHDTGLYGGAGLQVKLTGNLALTGEYERYGKEKTLGAKDDVPRSG